LKYCILIIFLKSLIRIFLCLTAYLSPYKIYLETGHLIENFVKDWYLTTNMLELGDRLKCWLPVSKVFFILFFVYHSENFRNAVRVCVRFDFASCHLLRKRVCILSWNVND